jgi:hypothetical protein
MSSRERVSGKSTYGPHALQAEALSLRRSRLISSQSTNNGEGHAGRRIATPESVDLGENNNTWFLSSSDISRTTVMRPQISNYGQFHSFEQ